ncbi:MAG TPA: hypothetical protein VIH30_09435 [Aquirhabdus sp.]
MKKKYKNISGCELALDGFGFVKPNEVIETEKDINNANFEEVVGKVKEEIKKDNK